MRVEGKVRMDLDVPFVGGFYKDARPGPREEPRHSVVGALANEIPDLHFVRGFGRINEPAFVAPQGKSDLPARRTRCRSLRGRSGAARCRGGQSAEERPAADACGPGVVVWPGIFHFAHLPRELYASGRRKAIALGRVHNSLQPGNGLLS